MSDNFAQTVKQQADIVRVIGEYVKLRKSGAQNYTGLCPFHKEKTGSFSVNATHGYFYCFGCHEKGDVFTFLMKLESISFPEAVRAVATKCNIPLPKREFSSPEEAREAGMRKQLIDIHEAATQYFEAALKSAEAARAREYLTGRGVTADTIAKFRIGYAPDDFNHMRNALAPHFTEDVLRASGLFSAREQADGSQGQLYARFRKRITFPIANEQGKTIAFTGRASTPKTRRGGPSPSTSTRPRPRSISKVRSSSISTRPKPRYASSASHCWSKARWTASPSTWRASATSSPRRARRLLKRRCGCSAASLPRSRSSSTSTLTPPAKTPPKNPAPC